ncbi:hypothetical protein, partial [Chamaesiphon sp. OTE_20_metabat_361]|uniref:hypothetical protein n=1 Tax=Chamaesiphon sp. OTE_20_metabat_361 TaxID=2964689 RepID=UPI002869F871
MIEVKKQVKYLMCGGLTLFALAGAAPAHAVSFVNTFRPSGNTTEVGTVDPATGAYTRYSSSELQLTDIALNTTNQLYGVTYDQLYRLNAGTNTQAIVGDLGVTGINGLAFDNKNNLYGLGGRSTTNGIGNPGFYSISTSNGVASLISNLGALAPTAFGNGNATNGDSSDLVFNPSTGEFLAVSGNNNAQLLSISLTGTTRTIGTGTGFNFVSGLTLDGGVLRGYTTNKNQITIDIATGVGAFDKQVSGIVVLLDGSNSSIGGAASTISATAVPEPSAMGGFAFLGVCFGARMLLKRKQR